MLKFDFNLLWTVINLVIFFLLMRLFLFKPIKKTLAAREEMLKNKFQQADDTVNEANQKLAEYEEHIANVDEEAKQIVIDADKAKEWLAKGAQPTDTVMGLLVSQGIVEKK